MTTTPASLLPSIACSTCKVTTGLCIYMTGASKGKPRTVPHAPRIAAATLAALWYDRGVSAGAASRQPDVDAATSRAVAAEKALAAYEASHPDPTPPAPPVPVTLYENAATTRVTLPANKHGGGAGINKPYPLAKTVDEATCTYEVMFDPDFTWHLGGKLPGPVGVVDGTSPTWPTGGKPDPDNLGWSGRLMWMAPENGTMHWLDGTKHRAKTPAEIISYVYHPGQWDDTGDNVSTGYVPTPGEWFTVTQRNVMNTPGQADGILQLWINGQLLVDRHDFTYRVRADLHITHFLYVCFPGGDSIAYEAAVDRHVTFRNVLVTTPG